MDKFLIGYNDNNSGFQSIFIKSIVWYNYIIRKVMLMVIKYKQRVDIIDILGKKFGDLTVIKLLGSGKNRGAIWLCKCDCGKECEAYGSQLRFGSRVSCGCRLTSKLKQSKINQLFYSYKIKSVKRNHDFNITRDFFESLIFSNCFYCNDEPRNKLTTSSKTLIYNGIDRIDSTKGYEDNI